MIDIFTQQNFSVVTILGVLVTAMIMNPAVCIRFDLRLFTGNVSAWLVRGCSDHMHAGCRYVIFAAERSTLSFMRVHCRHILWPST